jgi:hypothetical protein
VLIPADDTGGRAGKSALKCLYVQFVLRRLETPDRSVPFYDKQKSRHNLCGCAGYTGIYVLL